MKNTFYWKIANLNFTQSNYCTMIIKMVKFQRNRMCRKFHIRIQFFVHSKSLLLVLITMTGSSVTWNTIGWKIREKLDFTRRVIVQLRFVCLIHSLHSCRFLFQSWPKRYLKVNLNYSQNEVESKRVDFKSSALINVIYNL